MNYAKRYSESKTASAEILRIILEKISSHPAAFTPPVYAVWYEFTTGINTELTSAMMAMFANNEKITAAAANNLYETYIAQSDDRYLNSFRSNMQHMIDGLGEMTLSAEIETGKFCDGMKKHSQSLEQASSAASLNAIISDIAEEARIMGMSVEALRSNLKESRVQVDLLQNELHKARNEALIDPLTEVANRRGFDKKIKEIIKKGGETPVCVMILDIDFFKKINDNYGHIFGDKVIREVVRLMKDNVKGSDLVARIGGEEFAIILPHIKINDAFTLAEKIRGDVTKLKITRKGKNESLDRVTISIGIAACEHLSPEEMENTIANADKALYASKNNGRNLTTISEL